MKKGFDDIANRDVWIIELDAFYAPRNASDPIEIRKTDTSYGLGAALQQHCAQEGDVLFIARNPQLAEKAHGFSLPLNKTQIAQRIFTEFDIPNLKHGLNGGEWLPPGDAVLIGSDPVLAREFGDLGAGVVWLDKGEELNGMREKLAEHDNIIRVTVPKYIFLLMSRVPRESRAHPIAETLGQSLA